MDFQTTAQDATNSAAAVAQEEITNMADEAPVTDMISVRIDSKTFALVKRGTDVAKVKKKYKKRRW